MSDQPSKPDQAAAAAPEAPVDAAPAPSSAPPGKGARIGLIIVLALIIASLLWYFVADRLTPNTSQARVQAFVVPVAAEVAGTVLALHVKNDEEVQRGQPLFDIDPSQYRIALERSRSDYESVRSSVGASAAAVEAAKAKLQAARANQVKADKDATRQESLYTEDPGAISVRRLEIAQATRVEARSQEKAAEAELRKAQEAAGDTGDANAQLRSAHSAIEKAKLDLARSKVVAPARGRVADLRTDVGKFAQAGAPVMTLIANHDLWVSADMTENNLGNIAPGNEAAIVLDVLPGQVLKGRVRSVGGGVSSGQEAQPGTLPTIKNSRDWLRQAQRFPVAIEFDPAEATRLGKVLVGGQAEVMVFTGDNFLMNLLGAAYMRLMSRLSYLY
jgi:multidrug resistance efflux pump